MSRSAEAWQEQQEQENLSGIDECEAYYAERENLSGSNSTNVAQNQGGENGNQY